MVVASVLISFFYLQLSSFPSTIFWRDCLFSIVKDNLASFVKDKLPIVAWVSLGGFCPVPLICRSVFLPVPSCLDYCSFVIQSEVREPDSSSSIFRFQDCFGSSRLFCVPMETVVFLFWLDAIFSLRLLLLPASPFSLSALSFTPPAPWLTLPLGIIMHPSHHCPEDQCSVLPLLFTLFSLLFSDVFFNFSAEKTKGEFAQWLGGGEFSPNLFSCLWICFSW